MYNILICDDEKDIVNALKIYLNDTNYHFLEAFDGEEAVHMVETNEVHLVLMDIDAEAGRHTGDDQDPGEE